MAADTEVLTISLTMVLSGASNGSLGGLLGSQTTTYNSMLMTFVPQWVAQLRNQTDCYPTTLPPTLLPHRCPGVLASHGHPFMHPTRLSEVNRLYYGEEHHHTNEASGSKGPQNFISGPRKLR